MYSNYYQPNSTSVPTYQTQLRQQLSLKGRPVSSIEEARVSPIDFDGTVFYFPDLASKRIYTKQINLDGTATLLMYELKELPVEQPKAFVTREEFEAVINDLRTSLIQAPVPTPAPAPDFKF